MSITNSKNFLHGAENRIKPLFLGLLKKKMHN
nr:MAG TPA: hypothetical protein [Bacteriophage sp.]DAV14132.1 MAG TPA: hypothetical protein [Caudoviricetes sp.]